MKITKFKTLFQELLKNWSKPNFNITDLGDFVKFCFTGDLESIDGLLSKKRMRLFNMPINSIFNDVCKYGHLHIAQYLLTSPNTKKFHNAHVKNIQWIERTCEKGHIKLLQYLFTSSELKEHPDIHTNNDIALRAACRAHQTELIKFLISSPYLKEYPDVHVEKDLLFKTALGNQERDILHYLIFDYKIDKTQEIQSYLEHMKTNPKYNLGSMYYTTVPSDFIKEIDAMFKVRDLNQKLESELSCDTITKSNPKKLKI
jgi:hypothetical protein